MVRTAAKAVIIRDDHILVIANRDDNGTFYVLPGGGQERFESLHDALQRECLEEIATRVEIGELLFVRDYIARNHEFAVEEPDVHCVEIMFACRVPADYVPASGTVPDKGQDTVMWLPLSDVIGVRLYPQALKPILTARSPTARYLGDVN